MFRNAFNDLIAWKTSAGRKPLVLRGARQVGKTWLLKEFGKTSYPRCAYVNFENNRRMKHLFLGDLNIDRLVAGLQIESSVTITDDTLIIFDEVQEVPQALTSLKYFAENAPRYQIIAAGSLLGVALHSGNSFPVGKVDFMDLHPMNYAEFLQAGGHENLLQLLRSGDFELVAVFRDKYVDSLKQYYYIGGMPEAVSAFAETKDLGQVRKIHNRLLAAYEQDFSKHAPSKVVPRLRMLWNSLPTQLARENRKFVYGLIRQGARAREYELALQWLADCGLVHKVPRVNKPGIPLAAYQDFSSFKLYMLDVGMLGALSGLDQRTLLEGNGVFSEFQGALTEQYVLQQLIGDKKIKPYYWSADKSTAEVDFLFQYSSAIIPLEVKATENLQAKSLKSYRQRYQPAFALRCSLADYRRDDWLINLPLYAVNVLTDRLASLLPV